MTLSLIILLSVSLIIRPQVFEAGQVSEGDKVIATFVLFNDGNDTLIVKSIKPSCGCTYATSISGPIAPGDSVSITAIFDTKGYSGLVYQQIKVNFERGNSSVLLIKANVVKTSLRQDELLRSFVLILDLRDKSSFDREHLVSSIWIDKKDFERQFSRLYVPKEILIVLVGDEKEDVNILDWLKKQGYGNTYFLKDGFIGWKTRMKRTLVISREDQ
jgi:rhodanese-related sulfurtransferase